jgi:DNA-binding MarR family transcriptional regulator
MSEPLTLAALMDRLGRIAHALQFSTGLNPAQWEALRYLGRANRYSASPSALARYLGCTKGTVSQTLISLESKGYVNRVRGEPDGRSVRLELTESGRTLLGEDPLKLMEALANGLPAEDRAAATTVTQRMIRELCAAQGLSEFGVCGECGHLVGCRGGDRAGEERDDRSTCGLTGEMLDAEELDHICVNFRPVS